MDKIIDNLYLGDLQGASNLFLLKRNGITHILQVAAGFQPFFPGQFKYKIINVLDMPFENLGRYFQSGIQFMKQAIQSGGSVLVHCYAGISRSASMVIAYLMQELEMPMMHAMSYVRQRRPIIFPNPGFQKQLMEFEKSIRKQSNNSNSHKKKQQQSSSNSQNHRTQSNGNYHNNNKIGDKSNVSAPTVQNNNHHGAYQNFTEKLNSVSNNHNNNQLTSSPSPQKHKSIIDKVYASPISHKNMMNKNLIEQKQYVSQSADKGGVKGFQSRKVLFDDKNHKQQDSHHYNQQNLINSNQHNYHGKHHHNRAHTSQIHNRLNNLNNKFINNNYMNNDKNHYILKKQELENKESKNKMINNNNNQQLVQQQQFISPYQKQIRAKSSYGSKNNNNNTYYQQQHNQHLNINNQHILTASSNHKQRNISEHSLPKYQKQENISIDPTQAYFQLSQSQFHPNGSFNKATNQQNSTIGQSIYNSISRQRQESKESLHTTKYGKFNQQEIHSTIYQYYCDHCNMALFTSKDILDHSTTNNNMNNSNLSQRNQHKLHSHQQHKSQFSINNGNNQIFGKTFTDMNSAGQQLPVHKCGSLFIKRKDWILEQDGNEGNIMCPRKSCAVKIGTYCWQGTRCSTCGHFVSPSFQIFRNRVKYRQYDGQQQQQQVQENDHTIMRASQKYENIASRTPEQKRKNTMKNQADDNYQNHLNLSYTADSKASKSKTRRQTSNIEDLMKIKSGFQGLAQSVSKVQDVYQQNNGSSHHKRNKSSEKSTQQYQQLNSNQKQNHQQSQAQQLSLRKSNQNSLFGQGKQGIKNNLNDIYNQLMVEQQQQQQDNQKINKSNFKQNNNNYSSPKRSSQLKN